jgi:hypothetical protein
MSTSTSHPLRPEHAETLARLLIQSDMLKAAGVVSLTDTEARETLGLKGYRGADLSGILFPYLSPRKGLRVGGRIRLDNPLPDGGKYISEPGCRHLFFPPNIANLLSDVTVPVVVVEAEKSALALGAFAARNARAMLPIAIGGCWGWRRKTGRQVLPDGSSAPRTGPSPDLDLIAWQARSVFLIFDSNALTSADVQQARRAFAEDLFRRGASVFIAEVPGNDGVNGPDDLIAVSGDDAMLRVLECARSAVIPLRRGELPATVDRAEDLLLAHSERLGVFQRAGELVRVVSLPEPQQAGGIRRPEGSVQLEPLTIVALTEIFDRIAQWQRINHEGNVQVVDCPTRISAAYLSRIGFWRVPVLAGIISAPMLRENGRILSQPGYDKESGLLFFSDEDWPVIPDRPTRADAEMALETLRAPFEEFPFVAEEDVAVHVAAILTAIQRRTLEACPIIGYSAPAQRSGKSLLAESVAIIATGKPAPATAISADREEIRKAILSALREGHSIINLDNVEIPLASPDLAKAITQSEYQDRMLGESRMLRLRTSVLWTATGNNLTFRGDLSSRALLSRIDSVIERPEARAFKIPDLKALLIENRRYLVSAGLTILRAYHLADRPRQKIQPWGGFENWSESIREPLIWLGLPDPCHTREFILADDPELDDSQAALLSLRDAFADREFTVKEVVDRCRVEGALRSSILSLAAGRHAKDEVDPKRLGWWCRRLRDRVISGLRLHFCRKASGVASWQIIEVPAGGSGGHRGSEGHFRSAGGETQPADSAGVGQNDAGHSKNDLQNPSNHLDRDDEVFV